MVLKNRISTQYLHGDQITTTILDVINPALYVLKECPSFNSSVEARNFAEAEDSMQKYYESLEPCFIQMPVKDTIVVILFEKKFYRAKVVSILTMSTGHMFKVYLLDYGQECSVPRNCLYEIQKDFLSHPFQAVNFKLLGIEPVSLVMSSMDLSVSYGPVTEWDLAAVNYIHDLQKVMCSAYIEIKAFKDDFVYGNLFMTFADASIKCINDELIERKFAHFNENCWENVQKIGATFEYLNLKDATSPLSKSSSPESKKSHSPNSNTMELGIDCLKVSFIRPSDGKIMGETSLHKELKSPEIHKTSPQEKLMSPSDGKIMGETSLHKELKSPEIHKNSPQEKLMSPPDGKIIRETSLCTELKSPEIHRNSPQKLMSPSDGKIMGETSLHKELKSPEIHKNSSQEMAEVDSLKKLQMLQRIHKLKQVSSSGNNIQCDSIKKSPNKLKQDKCAPAENNLSKESKECIKLVNQKECDMYDSNVVNSSDNKCNVSNHQNISTNEPKKSNVTVSEISPKQEIASTSPEIMPGNIKKLQMLQKLKGIQHLQSPQSPEKPDMNLSQEGNTLRSQSSSDVSPQRNLHVL